MCSAAFGRDLLHRRVTARRRCRVYCSRRPARRGSSQAVISTRRRWSIRYTRFGRGNSKKARHRRPEAIHVDQERIMPLDRRKNPKIEIRHDTLETLGEFLLLMRRKEKVGFDTDDQSSVELQPRQTGGDAATVVGGVEQVHCA